MLHSNHFLSAWHTRPVFLSSTFKDMQAERDYLRSHVFPELEEKLRKNRHHLELIDLRIGVETAGLSDEEEREVWVLKVCLEEIRRSRPFLIVLLGDRYGWVPPPERVEAATQEAGFYTEIGSKSVTALEIEFGVLKEHVDQRNRTFFFFRDPLPYAAMPSDVAAEYCDLYSPDTSIRARHSLLISLKSRLSSDPEFIPRVFAYHAEWDKNKCRVTGFGNLRELIVKHVGAALLDETRAFATQPPQTWQQRERAALLEFMEQQRRGFAGRTAVIEDLVEFALSPPPVGTSSLGSLTWQWGACISGVPGSGKSSLIAELYARLNIENSVLLLANATANTPRGREPESALRRFIGELADAAGEVNPIKSNETYEELETTFLTLMDRVSTQRRIVVLMDSIDLLDLDSRKLLRWLKPKHWPRNARLIASATPDALSAFDFSKSPGLVRRDLPQLAPAEIAAIAGRIYARYHRQPNTGALHVLAQKKGADGLASAGNPLWLTLAVEQLNLFDADDFARADVEFSGSPDERLRALVVERAKLLPPDISTLYIWMLEYNERAFGIPIVRAFAGALASGRLGWRDVDMLALVPRIAAALFPNESTLQFDELRLALLRRGFRSQLVRRGPEGLIGFAQPQLSQAIASHVFSNKSMVKFIHTLIADYLETLTADDEFAQSELPWHRFSSGDLTKLEQLLTNPNRAMAFAEKYSTDWQCYWRALNDSGVNVEQLCQRVWCDAQTKLTTCEDRLHFSIWWANALESVGRSSTFKAAIFFYELALQFIQTNKHWQYEEPVIQGLSQAYQAVGEYERAQKLISEFFTRIPENDPRLANMAQMLKVDLESTGGARSLREAISKAVPFDPQASFSIELLRRTVTRVVAHRAGATAHRLSESGYLTEAETLLREVVGIIEELDGPESRDLSHHLNNLGLVLRKRGEHVESEGCYRRALAIDEWHRGPHDPWVAIRYRNLGAALLPQGRLEEAERYTRRALEIDEHNYGRSHRSVAIGWHNLGEIYKQSGNFVDAEDSYRKSLEAEVGSGGADKAKLFHRLLDLAEMLIKNGHLIEADDLFRRAQREIADEPQRTQTETLRVFSTAMLLSKARNKAGMKEGYTKQPHTPEERRNRLQKGLASLGQLSAVWIWSLFYWEKLDGWIAALVTVVCWPLVPIGIEKILQKKSAVANTLARTFVLCYVAIAVFWIYRVAVGKLGPLADWGIGTWLRNLASILQLVYATQALVLLRHPGALLGQHERKNSSISQ